MDDKGEHNNCGPSNSDTFYPGVRCSWWFVYHSRWASGRHPEQLCLWVRKCPNAEFCFTGIPVLSGT